MPWLNSGISPASKTKERPFLAVARAIPIFIAMDIKETPARQAWLRRSAASLIIAKSLKLTFQGCDVFSRADMALSGRIDLFSHCLRFKFSGKLTLLEICDRLFQGRNLFFEIIRLFCEAGDFDRKRAVIRDFEDGNKSRAGLFRFLLAFFLVSKTSFAKLMANRAFRPLKMWRTGHGSVVHTCRSFLSPQRWNDKIVGHGRTWLVQVDYWRQLIGSWIEWHRNTTDGQSYRSLQILLATGNRLKISIPAGTGD
jgi:hypothetical protein